MRRLTIDSDRTCAILLALAVMATAVAAANLPATARAETALLDGDVSGVAVGGDLVVALRNGEPWLVTTRGRVVGRLGAAAPAPAPVVTPRRRASADEVVDLLGLADDDPESDLTSDALDDENLRAARRRRGGRGPREGDDDSDTGAPRVLAASRDAIWIGAGGSIAQIDAHAATAQATPLARITPRRHGLSALAVTPDGRRLVALTDHEVVRSGDGGRSWSLLAALPTRPRALALAPDNDDTYVLDEEGVAIVTHGERFPIFTGPAHDLVWCDGELLIAGADATHAWSWGAGLNERGPRSPARRLACAPSAPGAVIAFAPDLWISGDGGRSWQARGDVAGRDVQGVAVGGGAIWIGARDGLYRIAWPTPSESLGASPVVGVAGDPLMLPPRGGEPAAAMVPAASAARASPWQDLLPAVSLLATRSATRPGGDRGALLVLLTFPLQRGHPGAPGAARLAAERLRRQADAAAALARLSRAPASDEESAALARLARDCLRDGAPR